MQASEKMPDKKKPSKDKKPTCLWVEFTHPDRKCAYLIKGFCTFSGDCKEKGELK
jgi:hypothetical protein